MSFFKRILGKKSTNQTGEDNQSQSPAGAPVPQTQAETAPTAGGAGAAEGNPANDPNLIRTVDDQGREVFLPRQEWRERVLLPHLEKVMNDPEQLAVTILLALNDGFLTDLLEPAEQLKRIDPNPERGAVVLSIVYRELERLESAEAVLRQHIEAHGESGIVLVNLAKVQLARGEGEVSQETLWRAFELDPNQPDGFAWCAAASRAEGGVEQALALVRRVATLPGSWRARLWLARGELAQKRVEAAVRLYREALSMAGKPPPADLLVQMSSDLGQAGFASAMLGEVGPLFDAAAHGLPVANNLFRACLELGEFDAARGLLDYLHAQQQIAWKPQLGFWEGELTKARAAAVERKPQKPTVAMLVDDGPVWLPPQSPARELFPAGTEPAVRIGFLGSSADCGPIPAADNGIARKVSNAPGRMSRALPLFLAEQVWAGGRTQVRPMVPWVRGEAPAFLLGRQAWSVAEVAQHGRNVQPACEFVVATHVDATAEAWRVDLRLVRVSDATELGAAKAEFAPAEPEQALRGLSAELLALLQREAGVPGGAAWEAYEVPTGADFASYLARLEQLLTVRCNTMPEVPAGFLGGEREILDGALHLCLTQPQNVAARLVFAQLLLQLRPGRPQVVAEYRAKVQLLQKDKPLAAGPQSVIDGIFGQLYA